MQHHHPPLVSTGLPVLDHLVGGGLNLRHTLIVSGEPGSGKTLLASQIAFAFAARGEKVVIATVTSESHDKLLGDLRGMSFFDPDRIGNEIFLVSAYPSMAKGAEEAKAMLLKTVREHKARVLFVDGLRSVRDLWQDESQVRKFLYDLNVGLAQSDCLGLFTTEYRLDRLLELPEATTVDGIIALSSRSIGERRLRRIEVVKLRGRPIVEGQHAVRIGAGGIEIFRRIETRLSPTEERPLHEGQASFGLPELDKLFHGGLPVCSTTLLAGSTGIGKTLLALHFAANAAAQGQRALFVSYSEPVATLVRRVGRLGLDLRPLIASGAVTLQYRPVVEVEADELAEELLSAIDRSGAERLVVDGIGELQAALADAGRARPFLTALTACLRHRCVTSLFTREVSKITGPELDFSDTPLAVMAENFLFLRHLELAGKLHRIVSILKLREGPADEHLREFTIRADGIRVLAPFESVEGLLTGLGRAVAGAAAGGAVDGRRTARE